MGLTFYVSVERFVSHFPLLSHTKLLFLLMLSIIILGPQTRGSGLNHNLLITGNKFHLIDNSCLSFVLRPVDFHVQAHVS